MSRALSLWLPRLAAGAMRWENWVGKLGGVGRCSFAIHWRCEMNCALQAGGFHAFGNLTGGELGEGGEDQFGFAHVIAEEGFGGGDIGEVFLAVGGRHFQSVTICHRLTALFGEPLLELVPIFSGCLVIRLLFEEGVLVLDGNR